MVLDARLGEGEVHTRITDYGSWKTPAANPVNSGRGLPLMKALSQAMELRTSATGTVADITFRRPAE